MVPLIGPTAQQMRLPIATAIVDRNSDRDKSGDSNGSSASVTTSSNKEHRIAAANAVGWFSKIQTSISPLYWSHIYPCPHTHTHAQWSSCLRCVLLLWSLWLIFQYNNYELENLLLPIFDIADLESVAILAACAAHFAAPGGAVCCCICHFSCFAVAASAAAAVVVFATFLRCKLSTFIIY